MLSVAVFLLAAAVVIVPLAHRFGLGAIVGYLLVGLLLGPAGLGVVHEVEAIATVSELGVVLMLFVIGLELELGRLWAMRRDVLLAGALQFVLCGLGLAGAAWLAGVRPAAALLVGLTGALSSTAIAVQLMNERNWFTTPAGRTAFGILLFQDLAAIPLVTLAAFLAPRGAASGSAPGWHSLLALVAVVAIGRLAMRPLFRFIATSGLREIFTATALLVVLAVAWLMHAVGLSMGLGAFLAGVLFADSEYRKALETDIEPFKGLLLGLFFVAVGMSVDLAEVRTHWQAVLATLGVLLVVKAAMLYGLARALRVPIAQRAGFSMLLVQGGEFGFVVFAAAQQSTLLTTAETSVLNAGVALSMAVTPLLFAAAERWSERRGKGPVGLPEETMEEAPVIIAGFGRVGQIVGRLLFAHGIKATVIDHDPEQIEALRKFGFKIHYGDATRLDLLQTAGAAKARLLINAIDDPDQSLELVDLVQGEFPDLPIMARARNVRHQFELMRRGVPIIERETLESSLRLGRAALVKLGFEPYRAKVSADVFRRHNESSMQALFQHFGDEERLRSAVKEARSELEESIQRDLGLAEQLHAKGW